MFFLDADGPVFIPFSSPPSLACTCCKIYRAFSQSALDITFSKRENAWCSPLIHRVKNVTLLIVCRVNLC
ncbi:hypothetical protein FKM82_015760 [Ascaphus truei]